MAQGIDSLISNITAPAFTCLFRVQIVGPPGAANSDITRGFANNGEGFLTAQTVTLPGKSLNIQEAGGSRNTIKPIAYGYKTDEVNIDFILTDAYLERDLFEKWFDLIINPGEYRNPETGDGRRVNRNYMAKYIDTYAGTVIITQLDSHQKPMYDIILHKAYPNKISSIELNASAVELSKLSVSFSYYDYDTKRYPA